MKSALSSCRTATCRLWSGKSAGRHRRRNPPEALGAVSDRTLSEQLQDFERSVIRKALDACGGNKTKAMERLGLSRRTFCRKYGGVA